jgi:hypothetical protein
MQIDNNRLSIVYSIFYAGDQEYSTTKFYKSSKS